MRNGIVAVAGLCLAAAAQAQSSVSLYGTIDDGLTYTNNQGGHAAWQLSNGAYGSSKWGILMNEDLGGGYQTVARLENGFDVNSGALGNNGRLFGRQAYVGISGSRMGTILLGRQYDLVSDALMPMAASLKIAGTLATHVGDIDNIWGDYPLSNVVKYNSPTIAGVHASALMSLGGVAGNFAEARTEAFSLGYARGPLVANAVISRINNPAQALYYASALPTAGQPYANPLTNPTFSGYASARTMQTIGVGVNYQLGPASIGAIYTNVRFEDVVPTPSTPFAGTATFNTGEINCAYNVTPAWMTGAAFTYTKAETARYDQVSLGTKYLLSKRTFLYVTGVWEHASGTDSLGNPATAALAFIAPSTTQNQLAFRAGIRHFF